MNWKDTFRTLLYKNECKKGKQLITTWGENIDKNMIHQEYPRPQMVRSSYINLNGTWNYTIEDAPLGIDKQTSTESIPLNFQGNILVPFSPECYLSGVEKILLPGQILWYKKVLFLEDIDKNKRCILHFTALDQYGEIYLNGKRIGEHTGGYLPFSFDITQELKAGKNNLVIKVKDDTDHSFHARGKQKLEHGGMFYTPQSGIWQTVWMEWVPQNYISDIKMTPYAKKGMLEVEVFTKDSNEPEPSEPDAFQVMIYFRGELIDKSEQNNKKFTLFIKEEDRHLWSTDDPQLYDLIIEWKEDRIESYFALRDIKLDMDNKSGRKVFYLNDKKVFLNGLLDQGFWPESLGTPPSDEALIFDIEKAKELGFNMLRKHIKIEAPRFYYHCDKIGMLVWQDMVNGGEEQSSIFTAYLPTALPYFQKTVSDLKYSFFGRKNDFGRKEWEEECIETIRYLYNHPSIVTWVAFNEAWGQFDSKRILARMRTVDSTRSIDHASGWYDQGIGDFRSEHNYFRKQKIKKDTRAYVISEFGGFACCIIGHSFSEKAYGYRMIKEEEELNKAFHELYENEIFPLVEQGLCGVVYTQLSDVEEEVNGLFTYDRRICKVKKLERVDN